MNDITRKTIEILRGHAYSEEKDIKTILKNINLSRAAISKVLARDGDFNVDTCEDILNECGYTLQIKQL